MCLAVFVAVVSADVSHLFNKQKYQPYRPSQYYQQAPAVPIVPVLVKTVPAAYARTNEAAANILRLDNIVNPDGSYQYA